MNNKKLKILFVSQYFFPETFKGNEIVFDFVNRGHELTVVTGLPNYPQGKFYEGYSFFGTKEEVINGAKIIRTPIFPRKNGKGFNLILNYLSFVFFSYFTCIFRVKGKYDLIFIQQLSPVTMALPGIWLKKKFNIPLFIWVLDLWPESIMAASNFKNTKVIKLIDNLVKYIYNKADIILISSLSFKESIDKKLIDKNKQIIYFPNWAEDIIMQVNDDDFEDMPKLPIGFNIMFTGNVGEAQDFETILKAAELTKLEINWIIVGDGRKMIWIKEQIQLKNINNVFLLGRFSIDKMSYFMKLADVMLVSLKNEEVFSLTVPAKIQTYLASSKIILGSINGEGKLHINNSKCGIAIDAGNPILLAEKALYLKNLSPILKKEMEENSKKYYDEKFSKKVLFDSLENCFYKSIN